MKETIETTYRKDIATGFVVVKFESIGCGPCKMLNPILERLEKKFTEITFLKFNVDEGIDVEVDLDIVTLPTLVIYKDGIMIDNIVGLKNEKYISEKLENVTK